MNEQVGEDRQEKEVAIAPAWRSPVANRRGYGRRLSDDHSDRNGLESQDPNPDPQESGQNGADDSDDGGPAQRTYESLISD